MSTRRLDSFQRFMAFVSPTHSRKCILPRIVYWTQRNCLFAFGHLTLPIKDLDRYGCLTIELDVTSVHLGCVVQKGEITWFQDNCPSVLFNKISLFTSYDIYYVRQQYIKSIARYQHRHSDWHWHYTWFDIDINISFRWEYVCNNHLDTFTPVTRYKVMPRYELWHQRTVLPNLALSLAEVIFVNADAADSSVKFLPAV